VACGLASIPSALTALSGSLTTLALPYNDDLQLAEDDVVTLLALRKLQNLDLRKFSLWSPHSLQHLVDLPNAFHARHGHALALQVQEELDD